MEEVRRPVEAQPARRESGDRSLSLRFQQLFREGGEGWKMEVTVQTVERQDQRLLLLASEGAHLRAIEHVPVGPEVDAAMADVAHQAGSAIESVPDRLPRRVASQPVEIDR